MTKLNLDAGGFEKHHGRPAKDDEELKSWILFLETPCGMIFEFKTMEQAEAFAAAVKSRFGLDGRVFDDAEAAARSHFFPWVQYPPVVHVDRVLDSFKIGKRDGEEFKKEKKKWQQEWEDVPKSVVVESMIEKMAKEQFGGEIIGT